MRKILIFSVIFLFIVTCTGCQLFRTSKQPDAADKAIKPPPAPPEIQKIPAEKLFEEARVKYIQAGDLMEQEKYDQARDVLDESLTLAMKKYDREANKEFTLKLDDLFLEICITQVQLGQLRGTFIPDIQGDPPMGVEIVPEIETWLTTWLTSKRSTMKYDLVRSGRYTDMMEVILKEKGLPTELKYLPIIESGYHTGAVSSASAVGIWQFIKGTGKRYNLRIDTWVDERRDPEKATRAAAAYLNDLYLMFQNWPLALASYNCGEGRVEKQRRRQGTDNFYALELPNETCNYVPQFFAAMLIARNPEKYGFFVTYDEPMEHELLILERPADLQVLSALSTLSYSDLKQYNPELLSQYTPPKDTNYALKIPKYAYEEFKVAFDAAPAGSKFLSKAKIKKLKAPKKGRGRVIWYKVKRGDSLYKIAIKYKTTVKVIRKYNRKTLRGRKFLQPGMKLKIYPGRKK